MPSQPEIFRLRPDAATWLESEGQTVLLDLERARYLGLNRAGTLLWEQLAAGTTRGELIERLRAAYDLDDVRAGADVDEFLNACRQHNLLADA